LGQKPERREFPFRQIIEASQDQLAEINMKAVVFHGIGDIRLDEVPEPKIQDSTDAIVRLTASAICGTDLHMIRGTFPGMTSVIDAYKAFDTRQPGWVKVELVPGVA